MKTLFIEFCKRVIMANEKVMSKYGLLENAKLTTEDWMNRWDHGHIGFHSTKVNPHLLTYEKTLLGSASCRVFVPLCGKSVDMKYLAVRGHQVVGLECSSKAVEAFFTEQSLSYELTSHGPFEVYKSTTKNININIYNGDFFSLLHFDFGNIDAIWDRASWVAMDPEYRKKYADVMHNIMSQNTKYLLTCFEFGPLKLDGSRYHGPPFPISGNGINDFFDSRFNVENLDITEMLDMAERFQVPKFLNHNYILTKN